MKLFLPTILLCLACQFTSAQNPPCSLPIYSQFDFWIGEWEVYGPDGKWAGTNRIERKLGTCVLMENWAGAGVSRGHSFNAYNAQMGQWEQFWVDNGGSVIHFTGGWNDGEGQMQLRASGNDLKGQPFEYHLDFTPLPSGDVRQLWTAYPADGSPPAVLFDGLYRKADKSNQD